MLRTYLIISLSFLLTGCLPAVFTAATTTTVAAAKDQPMKEFMSDVKIAGGIRNEFRKNNFRELFTKIKVDVEQGRVLLTGIIDKEDDALKAVEISWNQKGVQEVINELRIDKSSNHFDLQQYTKDSAITAQIKTKIFFKRNIKFVNYTVVTVNNIVYLFGMARSEEELETVSSIAARVRGVEKVICHAKILDTLPKMQKSEVEPEEPEEESLHGS